MPSGCHGSGYDAGVAALHFRSGNDGFCGEQHGCTQRSGVLSVQKFEVFLTGLQIQVWFPFDWFQILTQRQLQSREGLPWLSFMGDSFLGYRVEWNSV